MAELESYGFIVGGDRQHAQRADYEDLMANDFFGQAEQLLTDLSPIVMDEVVPRIGTRDGVWNPGGFMAFSLGVHPEHGSLRLHVWPKGVSRHTAQGPNIHDHAWLLASRVLTGQYSDTFYEVEPVDNPGGSPAEAEWPRLYKTTRNASNEDVLLTDGTYVRPVPVQQRDFAPGDIHNINRGDYHSTDIPVEALVATLVLDSPAFADTTDVLIRSNDIEIARTRRVVEIGSRLIVKTQLLSAETK